MAVPRLKFAYRFYTDINEYWFLDYASPSSSLSLPQHRPNSRITPAMRWVISLIVRLFINIRSLNAYRNYDTHTALVPTYSLRMAKWICVYTRLPGPAVDYMYVVSLFC